MAKMAYTKIKMQLKCYSLEFFTYLIIRMTPFCLSFLYATYLIYQYNSMLISCEHVQTYDFVVEHRI